MPIIREVRLIGPLTLDLPALAVALSASRPRPGPRDEVDYAERAQLGFRSPLSFGRSLNVALEQIEEANPRLLFDVTDIPQTRAPHRRMSGVAPEPAR
jgi:hypothetical protein